LGEKLDSKKIEHVKNVFLEHGHLKAQVTRLSAGKVSMMVEKVEEKDQNSGGCCG
jgi:hypothetical protein